jgi:hypothetical protein
MSAEHFFKQLPAIMLQILRQNVDVKDVKGLQVALCILTVTDCLNIMQGWAAADGYVGHAHPDYSCRMQDGMYTQWDETLVADFVTDAAREVSPTIVSP